VYGLPSVIPFDSPTPIDSSSFAREDVILPEVKKAIDAAKLNKQSDQESKRVKKQNDDFDNDRPTGE